LVGEHIVVARTSAGEKSGAAAKLALKALREAEQ